ncbi:MAG: tRNA epoxyqueuosine(34) reductase QueG [Bacteroidales bacterium]|nr:tRNA epoxyqueuosine(34) reductase QueG [Bacteroidales bacterium]
MADSNLLNAAAFKAEALRLGAAEVGVAAAGTLASEWPYLQAYLNAGAQGDMAYLARSPETRCHPERLLPDVRTVAVCAFSYFPRPDRYAYHPRIARFAQGEDYHRVIRRFLKQMAAYLNRRHPEARCRGFVDTAPILEKAWAVRAGLGRIGRNDLLQNPRLGTYLFLGLLLTDVPSDTYDRAKEDTAGLPANCLHCRACVDACPTGALSFEGAPRLRADRCLAYATIEQRADDNGRKVFPPLRPQAAGAPPLAIFGCDRCQTVCPANRPDTFQTAVPEPHPAFAPVPGLAALSQADFARLDDTVLRERFAHSSLRRAGADGLKANLALWD